MPLVNYALALFLLLLVVATLVRWIGSYRSPNGKHFRRRLFGVIALGSSLMCVLVGIFWVRSYFVWDRYTRPYDPTISAFHFMSNRGVIVFGEMFSEGAWLGNKYIYMITDDHAYYRQYPGMVDTTEGWSTSDARHFQFVTPSFLGIRVETVALDLGNDHIVGWRVHIPHAWLAGVFAAVPSLWFISFLHRRRIKRRIEHLQCAACGYDLRAIETKTCPECGTQREHWTV